METVLFALIVASMVLVVLIAIGVPIPPRPPGDAYARSRAEALVAQLLTPRELEQLNRRGYLLVPSRTRVGRAYRVHPDGSAVEVVENGDVRACLCLQPIERLPGREVVLAHKLLLEADEREYWSRANLVAGRPVHFDPPD